MKVNKNTQGKWKDHQKMPVKKLLDIWWKQNIPLIRKIQRLSKMLSNFIWALNYLQFPAWKEKIEQKFRPLLRQRSFLHPRAEKLAGLHNFMSIKIFHINNAYLSKLTDFHFQFFLGKVRERNTALQYKISKLHLFWNKWRITCSSDSSKSFYLAAEACY